MPPSLRLASEAPTAPLPVTVGRIADFADDPVVCMRRLWVRHGDIAALQEDAQRVYFVFGPQFNKQVLSDSQRFHARFFTVRGPRHSAQRRLTSGLLSMNGDEHKRHRRIVMQPFSKAAISEYHDAVTTLAAEMLDSWRPGETRDINVDMTDYMLRLTSCILFGFDEQDLAHRVGVLTDRWVALNHSIGPAAFIPDADLTYRYDELLAAAEELETALKDMLRLRRGNCAGQDVLSLLLRAHDDAGGVSDDELLGHVALLFGAAHLTSAHTLTWTLFLLAQHPQVMEALHLELSDVTGGAPPRLEQIDRLDVLDRVLKESMRVLPASCYSQRITAEPVVLGPFSLPRGAPVVFSQFITHHLPELYPQPESFLPDRWRTLNPAPYAYLPFGGGPRMCLGGPLATLQFKITLPSILGRFKLTAEPHAEINARVMSTMLFPTSRVPLQIDRQDGEFHAAPVTGNIHTLVNLPPATTPVATLARRAA
ncbi:MAG: cytochrome P450 [Planctomycetaceae bacterium]|nr:cytochrome P450 [Planctomycetaceae bacterium]